jgi:hypothetical protein
MSEGEKVTSKDIDAPICEDAFVLVSESENAFYEMTKPESDFDEIFAEDIKGIREYSSDIYSILALDEAMSHVNQHPPSDPFSVDNSKHQHDIPFRPKRKHGKSMLSSEMSLDQ